MRPGSKFFQNILKYGGRQLVPDELPFLLSVYEPGVFQHAEMSRDRGPRRSELLCDLTRRSRPGSQQVKDRATRWIC